jgi:DivIVA domain-containing protein
MPDLETPAEGARPLDPTEVSERSFPTAFRGFDPVQVRSFLQTIADELRRLQAIEAGLVEVVHAEVQADVAEEAVASSTAVEEARLEAEQLVKDARDRVATLGSAATAEASRVLEEARAEAARLRATALDDLKGRFDEAESTAVRKIAEAEREAAAIRVKAREEAEATIEAARVRGREMVAEAQAARERMLADLAKRKRAAQAQLEQLRAGRDRLLDTLKVARRSIDEMTTRFDANEGGSASTLTPPSSGMTSGQVTTTPGSSSTEARPRPATTTISTSTISDPQPPRPVRTRAVAIGEAPPVAPRPSIAAPQAASSAPAEAAPGGGAAGEELPPVSVESRPNPPSPPAPPPAAAAASEAPPHERRSSALRILRRNKGNDGPPATPPLIGRDSPAEGVRIIGRTPEDEPEPTPPTPPVVDEPAAAAPAPTAAEQDAADDVAAHEEDVDLEALLAAAPPPPEPEAEPPPAEPEPEAVEAEPVDDAPIEPLAREEIRPRIEDLFARIRADREAATTSARQVLAATPEQEPQDAPLLVAEAPTSNADEGRLQARDAVTEPLVGQLTKRLKRALQDEQNASLDRLRTSRGHVTVDHVLAAVDDQRAPYRSLTVPFLEQAARAGAAASPFGPVAVGVDDLAGQLAEDLAGALRTRLDTVLAAGAREELDLSGIGERISSVYRDWKVQKLERLAMHYLVAAHERGGFLAQPEGTPLRWIVDDEGPCPDCEDNALAGPTPRGESFPTGQLHPPAHLGCRCLLTPARN